MKKYNCFWNGYPAICSVINVLIHSVKEPKAHWQNPFAGELRQVLVIEQNGYTFMIDNAAGDGWRKVTEGMGSPTYGSRHLATCTVVNEVPEGNVITVYNPKLYSAHNAEFRAWYKATYPHDFKRYDAMIKKSEELRKNQKR